MFKSLNSTGVVVLLALLVLAGALIGASVEGELLVKTNLLLTGKMDGNVGTVDDDDCTGEQGWLWFDNTDSQWEACNADSGTPVALTGGGASDYTLIVADWTDRAGTCDGTTYTLHQYSIPANTFAAGDFIKIKVFWKFTGTNGTKSAWVTYGTLSSIITRNQAAAATSTWTVDEVTGMIASSTSHLWQGVWFAGDASTINSAYSSRSDDTSTTLNLSFRNSCTSGDTLTLDGYIVERIR